MAIWNTKVIFVSPLDYNKHFIEFNCDKATLYFTGYIADKSQDRRIKTWASKYWCIFSPHKNGGHIVFVCLLVFDATFNNISVISWRSVLLVEETGGPGENHQPVASHWQTLSHNVVLSSPWSRFELTTSVVIGTDCIGSCKSNYHTITATMPPGHIMKWCCC